MDKYQSHFAHGLMFHRFHKSGTCPKGQGSLSDSNLETIINHVGRERILSPDDWLMRSVSNQLQPDNLCVTFDDGLKSQFEIALPILDKYRIKAFWFIFSSVFMGGIDKNELYNRFAMSSYPSFDEFVDDLLKENSELENSLSNSAFRKYLDNLRMRFPFYTENDIKFRFIRNHVLCRTEFEELMDGLIISRGLDISEMAEDIWMCDDDLKFLHESGHTLGLHSYSHPFVMADLSLPEQEEEYRRNYQHITGLTKAEVRCMSHPLNSYSEDTLAILGNLRIACGFRSNMDSERKGSDYSKNLEIPREDPVNLLSSQKFG